MGTPINKIERKNQFLQDYLSQVKAKFTQDEDTFHISLPSNLVPEFGVSKITLSLTSSLDTPSKSSSPSKLFFDKIYQLCQEKGEVTSCILDSKAEPVDVKNILDFFNVTVESGGQYVLLKNAIIFHFQVIINQPVPWRNNYCIAVDPKNFRVLDWIDDLGYLDKVKPHIGQKRVLSKKDLHDTYLKASQFLQERLERDLSEYTSNNIKHLHKEVDRISRYYNKVRTEEENRIKSLESQIDQIEEKIQKHKKVDTFIRYQTEKRKIKLKIAKEKERSFQYLQQINVYEEKEKRKEQQRHEIICKVNLLALGVLYYPVIREELRLFNEDSQALMSIYHRPITSDIEKPLCQSCREPTLSIGLCRNSHLICLKCSQTCKLCKKPHKSTVVRVF